MPAPTGFARRHPPEIKNKGCIFNRRKGVHLQPALTHDLRKVRFVQVAKRCASSAPVKYRAKLSWTLRDASDVVVSHLTCTAGPVTLGC